LGRWTSDWRSRVQSPSLHCRVPPSTSCFTHICLSHQAVQVDTSWEVNRHTAQHTGPHAHGPAASAGARGPYTWFPALRFRYPYRFCNRFRKKPCPYCRSVTPFRKRRCRSRHIGEWPGGPVGWRASFPRIRVGGALDFLVTATEK